MAAAQRPPSRFDPIDERSVQPDLRLTHGLGKVPGDQPAPEREQRLHEWEAVRATPDEVLHDKAELAKHDRGAVQLRKAAHAARGEADATRVRLAEVEKDRYPAIAVWGLGFVALATGFAWLLERRRVAELEAPSPFNNIPASPVEFPNAVEPTGVSEFLHSDSSVVGDEADQWIEQSKVAIPKT